MSRSTMILLCAGWLVAFAAGCGSSSSNSSTTTPATQPAGQTGTPTAPQTSTGSGVGAVAPDATSAATGDIPDTQVFLTYGDASARYSISYPEGWTRKGAGDNVTFSDKNNIVHIVITRGGAPSPAGVSAELNRLKAANPNLNFKPPTMIHVSAGKAVKATYTVPSPPNPVTGKTVPLIVDRYEFSQGHRRATLDLGTAQGVDNVDAYRRIVNSFRWL